MITRLKLLRIGPFPVWLMIYELFRVYKLLPSFHKGYAKVTCPLYDQISAGNASQKKRQVMWMEVCQEAFDMLKALSTSTPILAFAAFMKPFKLHTDASTTGLGAILYQEQGRNNWVIGYANRTLSKSESHYPAHSSESRKFTTPGELERKFNRPKLPCC